MENLYPLQDGILSIVKKLNLPFYLTGGTALGRYYLKHRYSDDLDFFVNNDDKYSEYIEKLYEAFLKKQKSFGFSIDQERLIKTEYFSQILVISNDNKETELKLEFVNDVAQHFGEIKNDEKYGKIDSWKNILSNKISALFRYEPKDICDIWAISGKYIFNWQQIIKEAKTKEVGVEPIEIFNILNSFPNNLLSAIKWNWKVDPASFQSEIRIIANDILKGNRNTLNS